MNAKTFQTLFRAHRKKLSEAFIRLSAQDWEVINGDLGVFLERASEVYKIPKAVLEREIEAVQKNIEEGIEADYVPYLDPTE